ncbi:P-loop containing nucleoside triphosphate hydrolase protein [Cyathus striatus]|nr:P-loop containing nucleoside triphosphate hydrolase protein [Cyathus striatus]
MLKILAPGVYHVYFMSFEHLTNKLPQFTQTQRPSTPLNTEPSKTIRTRLILSHAKTPWLHLQHLQHQRPLQSPRKGEENLILLTANSEIDMSNVDPAQVLVDYQSVILEMSRLMMLVDNMVSIRIRPSNNPSAWSPSTNEIAPACPHSHSTPSHRVRKQAYLHHHSAETRKTYTLTGDENELGIVPRVTRTSSHTSATCQRGNTSSAAPNPVQVQGTGNDISLVPLRENIVTSLADVNGVLKRGEGNRRTASTDWVEKVAGVIVFLRLLLRVGRGEEERPGLGGRQTPGFGGARLQARGGRSVKTSILSLTDLAGSEKATSDKEWTREGKYINTSLLTLGTVIGTLAENAARGKTYGSCTIPQLEAYAHSATSPVCTSTLLFAKRVKGVHLNAQQKGIVDTDALIKPFRKEIEDLKRRLAEREADVSVRNRRLSTREQIDETKAMRDLNARIKQLMKLILMSQTVDDAKSVDSRPVCPTKVDFDMSSYQLQQELLAARMQMEFQANQLLSLEAALIARPPLPPTASESKKDKLIAE